MSLEEHIAKITVNEVEDDDLVSVLQEYGEYVFNQFGIPFCYFLLKLIHTTYTHCSLFNMMVFVIKCIPMGISAHKIVNIYVSFRERLKQQQMDIEDIKLQIEIVDAVKINLRCSEYAERGRVLKKKVEEFYKIRTKVRELIEVNKELKHAIDPLSKEPFNFDDVPEEDYKLLMDLLKELKYDQTAEQQTEKNNCCQHYSEPVRNEITGYGANEAGEPAYTEDGENTSMGNMETKGDYHIKIAKVTIVYRVAYLRQYMKLRKGKSKLRKKMNNIKKLLDDWQKTLNLVINSNRTSLLNFDMQHNMTLSPQLAMDERPKLNVCSSSDSDSDLKNSFNSSYHDCMMGWRYNEPRPVYDCDNVDTDIPVMRKRSDLHEYYYNLCNVEQKHCECSRAFGAFGDLFIVPEETTSQVEIEKNTPYD